MRGIWIALEGTDGCGKTTQVARVRAALEELGHDAIATRAPGGTEVGQVIRSMFVNSSLQRQMTPLTEELLHAADLAQLAALITGTLDIGVNVVSDRSQYSSYVYSTHGKQNPVEWERLFDQAIPFRPDLTIVLDMSLDETAKRSLRDPGADAIEAYDSAGIEFRERIRDGYAYISRFYPNVRTINANGLSIEEVTDEIMKLVIARINHPYPLWSLPEELAEQPLY